MELIRSSGWWIMQSILTCHLSTSRRSPASNFKHKTTCILWYNYGAALERYGMGMNGVEWRMTGMKRVGMWTGEWQ